MKILVTGTAGFIGSHVVDAFIAERYDVAVVDNSSTDDTVKICRQLGVRVIPHCVN